MTAEQKLEPALETKRRPKAELSGVLRSRWPMNRRSSLEAKALVRWNGARCRLGAMTHGGRPK